MDPSIFEFSPIFQVEKMNAICQEFKVPNYLQLRVVIQKERHGEEVFIFNEMNSLTTKIFLFKLVGKEEEIAKIISR
jgi:hypothetical protein